MWSRVNLKENAKAILHQSYWKSVVAALVLGISARGLSGNSGISARAPITRFRANFQTPNTADFEGDIEGFFDSGADAVFEQLFPFVAFGVAIVVLVAIAIGLAVRFFVFSPLEVGAHRYFVVNHAMPGNTSLSELFFPFSKGYLNVVKVQFWKSLFLFLWTLLLVVPGIIKSYSYRLVPYILAEEPEMDSKEAFRLSMAMMEGNKMDAFVLDLSFIGWHFLNIFTFGLLGLFYVSPYQAQTNTELYATLRDQYLHGTGPENL